MIATMLATFFESRVVVVEYQRSILGWIVIGLIAGWLAGKISRGEGYGCITDIVLGLVGSLLGGWIFMHLGIFGRRIYLFAGCGNFGRSDSRFHCASDCRRSSLSANFGRVCNSAGTTEST